MNGWPALDHFLRTDPQDVGCAQAMEMLHVYAGLVAAGARRSSDPPVSRRTWAPAGRAVRTSKGCWLPCAARRPDRH